MRYRTPKRTARRRFPRIVCVSIGDTLAACVEDPSKSAVRRCGPGASIVVVNVAAPEAFNGTVPINTPSSWKVTVPLGGPDADATVATSITSVPACAGLIVLVSVVEVAMSCAPVA